MNKNNLVFKSILALAAIAVFLLAIPRAIYPSLHMDESYYYGAALNFLQGDLFLTNYSFDKPFLNFLSLVPGIFVGGKNAFGSHLAGLVFFDVSFVLCGLFLLDVVLSQLAPQKLSTSIVLYGTLLALVGIFCSPLYLAYGPGAFAEPFLLASLLAMLRAVWRNKTLEHAVFFFSVALCIKPTALLWAPILLMGALQIGDHPPWLKGVGSFAHYVLSQQPRSRLKLLAQAFVQKSGWLFALALFYMLTGPQKLIPLARFFKGVLGGDVAAGPSATGSGFFQRAEILAEFSNDLFIPGQSGYLALALFLSAVAASFLLIFYKRSKEVSLLAVPFWLHVAGLLISRGGLFNRYLIILAPQYIFLVFAGGIVFLNHFHSSMPSRKKPTHLRFQYWGTCTAAFFSLGCLPFFFVPVTQISKQEWKRWLPAESWGRLFDQLAQELPEKSIVHHQNLMWYLAPGVATSHFDLSCLEKACFTQEAIGRPLRFPQFVLLGSPEKDMEGQLLILERNATNLSRNSNEGSRHTPAISMNASAAAPVAFTQDLSAENFQQALRFKGHWQLDSFNVDPQLARVTLNMNHKIPCFLARALAQPEPSGSAQDCQIQVVASGILTLTQGKLAQETVGNFSENKTRWLLAWRLDTFYSPTLSQNSQSTFLLNFVPQLYHSFTLPLGPVAAPQSEVGYRVTSLQKSTGSAEMQLSLVPYTSFFSP